MKPKEENYMNNIKNENSPDAHFEEMMNHKFTAFLITLFIMIVVIWFWSFSFLSDGFENRNRYYAIKDTIVPVSATVTDIDITDSNYYISIDYSYNGEKFEDRLWKVTDKRDYSVGDIIEIKINPEYPRSIFSEDDGTSDFITAGIMFSFSSPIIIGVVIYLVKKRKNAD